MSAVISECGTYRYRLTRRVGNPVRGTCLFIMLNPSTADAENDDPTIRRCMGFAAAWGFGMLEVVNLFAFRATDPKALLGASDPVGPDNDRHIEEAARGAGCIVAAWGVHGRLRDRGNRVLEMLWGMDMGKPVLALGLTIDKAPKHPLYIRADTKPFDIDRPPAPHGEDNR